MHHLTTHSLVTHHLTTHSLVTHHLTTSPHTHWSHTTSPHTTLSNTTSSLLLTHRLIQQPLLTLIRTCLVWHLSVGYVSPWETHNYLANWPLHRSPPTIPQLDAIYHQCARRCQCAWRMRRNLAATHHVCMSVCGNSGHLVWVVTSVRRYSGISLRGSR